MHPWITLRRARLSILAPCPASPSVQATHFLLSGPSRYRTHKSCLLPLTPLLPLLQMILLSCRRMTGPMTSRLVSSARAQTRPTKTWPGSFEAVPKPSRERRTKAKKCADTLRNTTLLSNKPGRTVARGLLLDHSMIIHLDMDDFIHANVNIRTSISRRSGENFPVHKCTVVHLGHLREINAEFYRLFHSFRV